MLPALSKLWVSSKYLNLPIDLDRVFWGWHLQAQGASALRTQQHWKALTGWFVCMHFGPENLIMAAGIPFTIVRATQFFELLGGIAQLSTVGQPVHLPPRFWQPIANDDVASELAEFALGAPGKWHNRVSWP